MAELATLARPYANAAYELAKQSGRVDSWSAALTLLVEAGKTPEIRELIGSQVIAHVQKSHTLNDLLVESNSPEEVKRFVSVLAENHRLDLLTDIATLFEVRRAEDSKILDVTITSAVPLSNEQEAMFEAALRKRFDRDVSVTTELDPNLMGGAFIRAGDSVVDGSVRGKLAKMQEALTRA